ncbi:hypothetical protein BJF83_06430 [Nocardiopsis sp. CNR-923]|uniref:hypothetical protein n=1 Tax=Nocardiopsis sp. CNR-923 TaxID=1904965 RepID=UPI000964285F|nr:hypothetical protein [Nocardiopsis sp. CNR-923]OLT24616.1 hypothetical protein BJF83_06430 [Nocardiopsis sp. CNR-923]
MLLAETLFHRDRLAALRTAQEAVALAELAEHDVGQGAVPNALFQETREMTRQTRRLLQAFHEGRD